MLTIVAFLVALGILIAVHEYGHYRVAVACGIKVLRFSIGFGKPLVRWQRNEASTEFVLSALPLGGYVKMLDEREGPVAEHERHLAFNNRPLWQRAATVLAGPMANLLLAILIYSILNWYGIQEPRAVLSRPAADSIAAQAGIHGGELVTRAAVDGQPLVPVRSFDDFRWVLTQAVLDGQSLRVELQPQSKSQPQQAQHEVVLPLQGLSSGEVDAQMFRKIGILSPWTPPLIDKVMPDSEAVKAGLQAGDLVRQIGATDIVDGQHLREVIRKSVEKEQALQQRWTLERQGTVMVLDVLPGVKKDGEATVGVIGAYIGGAPEEVTLRYGPLDGLWQGAVRTWEVSALSLRTMGKMLLGQVSLKNLSGPLSIADYAGKSASMGLVQYLSFLAAISVSLGVLNLLPIPVLDGGHLLYYLWEGVTGKSVSVLWMERMQKVGLSLLLVMMSVAMFNDLSRYISRFFG